MSNVVDYFNSGMARGFAMGQMMAEKERKKRLQDGLASVYAQNPDVTDADQAKADSFQVYNTALAAQDAATFDVATKPSDYAHGNQPRTQEDVQSARNLGIARVLAESGDVRGAMEAEDRAARIGLQKRAMERQGVKDAMETRRDNQQFEIGQHNLETARITADEKKSGRMFEQEVNKYLTDAMQNNTPLEPAKLFEMAARNGQGPDAAGKVLLTKFNVDDATAKMRLSEQLTKLKAASTKGIDAMLEMSDPDPTDNQKPTAVKNKDGSLSVHYQGKPMPGMPVLPADNPGAALYTHVEGMLLGKPYAAAAALIAQDQAKATLAKTKSETAENYASAKGGGRSGNSPAAIQTAEWLVTNGVAKNKTEAWDMLGTSKEKSRESAIQDMAAKLMANMAYLNKPDKAIADATSMVDTIRGSQAASAAPQQGKITSRDRVEAFAKQKGIPYSQAERDLKAAGYTIK